MKRLYQFNLLTCNQGFLWVGLFCLALGLNSCKLPSVLGKDEIILDKNKVRGVQKEWVENVQLQIKQKPNRKILGVVKFHLWVHRIGRSFKKTNRFSSWLSNTVGEYPALLDSVKCEQSVRQISQYLHNQGYFYADVDYSVKVFLQNATVTYVIDPGVRYRHKKVIPVVLDTAIANILRGYWPMAPLQAGRFYKADDFVRERQEISDILRNQGYYFFAKEFVSYDLDSVKAKNELSILVKPDIFPASSKPFYIGRVNVEMDSTHTHQISQEMIIQDIHYRLNGYQINAALLGRAIKLGPGDLFSQLKIDETYRELVQLKLFRFINIQLIWPDTQNNILHCHIRLLPQTKQNITFEPQVTLADVPSAANITTQPYRNYGLVNSVRYTNNNLFHQADIFQLRLRNGFEIQLSDRQNRKVFYSFENSLNASLEFPGARFPLLIRNDSNLANRTQFSLTAILEHNRDFDRNLLIGQWNIQTQWRNWVINWIPVEINYVRTRNISNALINLINSPDGILIKSLYGQNLITSGRVVMSWSNQKQVLGKSWWTLRYMPLDLAGNSMRLMDNIFRFPTDSNGFKTILGARYFHFLRTELDARWNYKIPKGFHWVLRGNIGLGVPMGNTQILPFEKRYFTGGSISMRAWQPRTLGPGAYRPTNPELIRTGEVKVEVNAEMRFPIPIYKNYFEGALFADIGNVWNYLDNPDQELENFSWERFPGELAADVGLGLRLNFSFFMVRMDAAVPVRSPSEMNRWVYQSYTGLNSWFKATNLTLGIGYPF